MRDPCRGMTLRHQIADQRVIAFAPAFRCQQIAARAIAGKGVAGADHGDMVPGVAQPRRRRRRKPGVVGKDQPALARALGEVGGQINPGFGRTPLRLPAPVGEVRHPGGQRRRLDQRRLARLDEVGLALERIAGQRHLVAGRVPDRVPIHRHAASPGAGDSRHVPGVIGHFLLRVAQRRNHLCRRHAVGLCQRGHRPPRPHLDIKTVGRGGQRRHAGAEIDSVAQMGNPIGRVGRLRIGQRLAGAVGDQWQLRRRQSDPPQVVAKAGEDRFQHRAVGGDVDGNALGVDALGRQFVGEV